MSPADHSVLQPVLIGRESERSLLRERLDEARRGNGSVVMICGESGVGKSRLMTEGLDQVAASPDTLLLFGRGDPTRSQMAYGALVEVFREFLRHAPKPDQVEFGEAVVGLAPQLASTLVPDADHGPKPDIDAHLRQAVFVARTSALLLRLAQRRPVAVCLEDLHFADSASLKLLASLATQNADQSLIIVGTYRIPSSESGDHGAFQEEWLWGLEDRPHYIRIELERLSEGDTRALVNSCFDGSGFRSEFLQIVFGRSAGLPLHTLQYLGWLLDEGIIHERRGLWMDRSVPASGLPATFDAALQTRLRTLTDADQDVLRCAAAMGVALDVDLLAESVGLTPADARDSLARIERATHLIHGESGVFRFDHDLLRRSLSKGLTKDQWRDAHLRLAACLEQRDSADAHLLAHHYYQAGALGRAAPYLLAVARDARDAFAYWEAHQSLIQAIEGLHPVDDRALRLEALLGLAETSASLGDLDRCRELSQEVLDTASADGEQAVVAEARLQLGSVYARTEEWAQAEASLQESRLHFSAVDDVRSCATVDMRLGNIAFERSRLDEAVAYYSRAQHVAAACECPGLVGSIAGNLGVIATVCGDFETADRRYHEALEAYGQAKHQFGLSQTYLNQGMAHAARDRWHEALTCYSRAEQLARDMGAIDMIANVLINRSPAQIATGDFDGAEASHAGARMYYEQLRDGLGLAECGKVAGTLCRVREQYASADEQLRSARESYRNLDNQLGVAECDLELAIVLRHVGDVSDCRACLEEASELFARLGAEDRARKAAALLEELDQ